MNAGIGIIGQVIACDRVLMNKGTISTPVFP
jgi:hypothetical protein